MGTDINNISKYKTQSELNCIIEFKSNKIKNYKFNILPKEEILQTYQMQQANMR